MRHDEYCKENMWTMVCLFINLDFITNIFEVMFCMVLFIGIIKVRLKHCLYFVYQNKN